MFRLATIAVMLTLSVSCVAAASTTSVYLTLESYPPAQFPTVTTTIDVADIGDQVEISRQAALFALSPDGWDLENAGLGGWLQNREPPQWSGHLYFADIPVVNQTDLQDLFGYELTEHGGRNGPGYHLHFHTDEWVERFTHDIGESPDNYGVISGGMNGNTMHQCPVPDWGRFSVTPVPEPSTLILLSTGAIGLIVCRRRRRR